MAFPSSSLTSPDRPGGLGASRGHGRNQVIPGTPVSGRKDNPISIDDDDDELSTVESSHYFETQPTQIVNRPTLGTKMKPVASSTGTQPTQIVDRPFLSASSKSKKGVSSSPRSEVEVLRSSPFRSPVGLGSSMAPPGTTFRNPKAAIKKPLFKTGNAHMVQKRSYISTKDSSDELGRSPKYRADSSDDGQPIRGNIQPSTFQPTRPSISPKSVDPRIQQRKEDFEKYDPKTQLLARKLHKKLGQTKSLQLCAKTIAAKKGNMHAAFDLLDSVGKSPSAKPSPATKSASTSAGSTPANSSALSKRSSLSRTSSPSRSPSPAPKRRRLVRGRNPNNSPSSSQVTAAPLISLVDSDSEEEAVSNDRDERDDYDSESHTEADDEDSDAEQKSANKTEVSKPLIGAKRTGKILLYLEKCNVESLAADAKISRDDAKYMISKRPFTTVSQIRGVFQFKVVRKKRTKIDLGENVFDELNEHIKRLIAIDRIVLQCHTQGRLLSTQFDAWNMYKTGDMKDESVPKTASNMQWPREPMLMQVDMFSYQIYGVNWMWQLYTRGYGGILADDMGLGKTCQVIAFIALLVDLRGHGVLKTDWKPNLVVVPPSVLANWKNEFEKFAPDLSVATYSGSPDNRDQIATQILGGEYDVILTSYSQMSRPKDANWMNRIGINAAIFDEGHKLKNPQTKIYSDLIRVQAEWKLLVTGTPIQNRIMEIMSLLNFISPKLFQRDHDCISQLFTQKASLKEVSEGATILSDRIERARNILEPFILQRKKDDVLKLLPKSRRVVYCGMEDNQKALYEELVDKFRKSKTQTFKVTEGRKNDVNNPWIQLRKAAIHPQQFRRFFTDKKCREMAQILYDKVPQEQLRQPSLKYLTQELMELSDFRLHLWCRDYPCIKKFDCPEGSWLESGKVQKLLELVQEYKDNGDRVLIFTRFNMVIEILEECLSQANVNFRVLQGHTSVSDRQNLVDAFNEDTSITAFLLTTGTGGQGINLTAANKIILFDQSDNPQEDVQAESRAHRLGQKREVEVVRLLTKDSIEELIYKACQKKLELAGHITGHQEDISGEVIAEVSDMLLKGHGGRAETAERD